MNLLETFSFPAPFDIILCRNVAIYFSEPDRARMFGNFSRCLARDGSLIIGSTESAYWAVSRAGTAKVSARGVLRAAILERVSHPNVSGAFSPRWPGRYRLCP